jgi:hypothetical protein
MVLVTGVITQKDEVPRQFVQTFFLARQENVGEWLAGSMLLPIVLKLSGCDDSCPDTLSYYVLNDTFRFLDPHIDIMQASQKSRPETRSNAMTMRDCSHNWEAPSASSYH